MKFVFALLTLGGAKALAATPSLADYLKQNQYVEVPLRKNAVGHFECDLKVNGVVGTFTLDPGASGTVLDQSRADKFHLGRAGQLPTANSVEIGDFKSSNLQVALIDLSVVNKSMSKFGVKPEDGVLGGDILGQGNAIIDYKNNRLYLLKHQEH